MSLLTENRMVLLSLLLFYYMTEVFIHFQVKQEALWSAANTCMEHLFKLGFNHQFFNMEFFLLPNGQIKLMEVNGRMNRITLTLCSRILENGDCFEASIALSKGICPQVPTLKSGAGFAIRFYLTTFGSGLLKDFIDIDALDMFQNVEVNLPLDYHIKKINGDNGCVCGFADVYGEDLPSCLQQMENIKLKVLRKPDCSPWFGN